MWALLSKIPAKLVIYTLLTVGVLGFMKWAHGAVFDSGYDAATIAFQQKAIEQQNNAIAQARLQWESEQEAAGVQIQREEVIVERIKEVTVEIPVVVERIVEVTPECADLGLDFARVHNAAIHAANSGGVRSPDPQSSVNEALRPHEDGVIGGIIGDLADSR